MNKRKGVALITVLVVIVFTFILSITILNVYLGASKQRVSSSDYDELEYIALSGASIMATYITEHNVEFEEDFPFSTGYIEQPIETEKAKVYVNLTDEDGSRIYNIKSVAEKSGSTAEVSTEIIRSGVSGSYTYNIGNYIYR